MTHHLRTRAIRQAAAIAIATAIVVPTSAGLAAASTSKHEPASQRSTAFASVDTEDTGDVSIHVMDLIWAYCMQQPFPASIPICMPQRG